MVFEYLHIFLHPSVLLFSSLQRTYFSILQYIFLSSISWTVCNLMIYFWSCYKSLLYARSTPFALRCGGETSCIFCQFCMIFFLNLSAYFYFLCTCSFVYLQNYFYSQIGIFYLKVFFLCPIFLTLRAAWVASWCFFFLMTSLFLTNFWSQLRPASERFCCQVHVDPSDQPFAMHYDDGFV